MVYIDYYQQNPFKLSYGRKVKESKCPPRIFSNTPLHLCTYVYEIPNAMVSRFKAKCPQTIHLQILYSNSYFNLKQMNNFI